MGCTLQTILLHNACKVYVLCSAALRCRSSCLYVAAQYCKTVTGQNTSFAAAAAAAAAVVVVLVFVVVVVVVVMVVVVVVVVVVLMATAYFPHYVEINKIRRQAS